MANALRRLSQILHRRAPLDGLCLYRVGVGLLGAAESAPWIPHARELFSSEAFHLGPFAEFAPPSAVAFALCAALTASSLAVAAGACTHLAIAATLLLRGYLYGVDLINEKANASLSLVSLAILFFSQCGRLYSIDSWRARNKVGGAGDGSACIFPQRLLQLEFAQIYLFAGLIKLRQGSWCDGTTIGSALGSRWATELGVWISARLPDAAFQTGAIATIAYELAAPLCLFVPRFRPWVLGCGFLFHLTLQATLQVGALGPHFLLAICLLYPAPEAIRRVRNRSAHS